MNRKKIRANRVLALLLTLICVLTSVITPGGVISLTMADNGAESATATDAEATETDAENGYGWVQFLTGEGGSITSVFTSGGGYIVGNRSLYV